MMSTLQKELVAPKFKCFLNFGFVSCHIGDIGFFVPWYAIKVTKFTISNANIGCIYISVYLPSHFSAYAIRLHRVGFLNFS